MPAVYTNFNGDDLDAFERFLKAEGLKASPGLLRIFREWCRFVAGGPPIPRYSTLSPEQLNLFIGEAAEIKRALARCEIELLETRAMRPEDIPVWKAQQEALMAARLRIDRWIDGLIRTEKIIATPPVDLVTAQRLIHISYTWKSEWSDRYRDLLFSFLKLFIKIPPPPPQGQGAPEANRSKPAPAAADTQIKP